MLILRRLVLGGICAKNASIEGIKPRVLVGLGVTLVGLAINDWSL